MRILRILIPLLVLASPPAWAQKVSVDFDPAVDFSQYKTFAWKKGTPARSELTQKKIVSAVENQLTTKGLELVDDGADVYVVTHAIVDKQTKSRAANVGVGVTKRGKRGAVSVGGSPGRRVKTVEVGQLIIDLKDGGSGNLVWKAVASDTVKPDPEQIEKKIQSAVTKAFKDYPPT